MDWPQSYQAGMSPHGLSAQSYRLLTPVNAGVSHLLIKSLFKKSLHGVRGDIGIKSFGI